MSSTPMRADGSARRVEVGPLAADVRQRALGTQRLARMTPAPTDHPRRQVEKARSVRVEPLPGCDGSPTTTRRSVARDIPTYSLSRELSLTSDSLTHNTTTRRSSPLAAEDVPVEDVGVVPPGLPILLLRVERRPFELDRVAVTRGEERSGFHPAPSSSSITSSAAPIASSAEDATNRTAGPSPPREYIRDGARGPNASWICLVFRRCCGEGAGRPPQASHSPSEIGQLQPLVLPQPSQT
jgi:hypothetical protein